MDIGEGFKKFRKKMNMTQKDFSDKANISRSYLGNLEKNRGEPSMSTVKKILKPFGIDLVDFLIDYCGVSRTVPSHWIETMGIDDLEEYMGIDELGEYIVDLEEAENLNNKMLQTTLYLDDVFKEVVKEGNVHEVKEHQKRIILDYEYLSDNELYALRVFLETLKKMRK